ncbi:unnamed protein product [Protopolystoma xenopodis]|uniref:ubiquitinyl hydrolase 1 n=1 Tax=Protopolystoma xenopodis TaxID=117903 RepID=A0A3S5AWP7_9PLAT|nr:unnamed protein product [Protopolystoma xenopodis]
MLKYVCEYAFIFFSIVLECVDDDLYRQFSQLRNIRTDPVSLYSGSSMTSLHLSDCFDKFTALERLGMRDLWYCRKCKAEKRATKKFDLWSLPKVLVIHLKRFRSNLRFHDKIDTLVNFPIK